MKHGALVQRWLSFTMFLGYSGAEGRSRRPRSVPRYRTAMIMGTSHDRLTAAANSAKNTGRGHPRPVISAATAPMVGTHMIEKTRKATATIASAARNAGRPQSLPRRNAAAVTASDVPSDQ